ncbi:hypothetical protein INR49_015248 [Caranx melampygus]|nr:hypothetical protein INR49_015248 [Caranx melampygus]
MSNLRLKPDTDTMHCNKHCNSVTLKRFLSQSTNDTKESCLTDQTPFMQPLHPLDIQGSQERTAGGAECRDSHPGASRQQQHTQTCRDGKDTQHSVDEPAQLLLGDVGPAEVQSHWLSPDDAAQHEGRDGLTPV